MTDTKKTDQEISRGDRGEVVAWNPDGTLYRFYDSFEDCAREFPYLVTPKMIPCTAGGKKLGWLKDLDPVDKLRIVAIDSARNAYN